jgi:hypothetical protein
MLFLPKVLIGKIKNKKNIGKIDIILIISIILFYKVTTIIIINYFIIFDIIFI